MDTRQGSVEHPATECSASPWMASLQPPIAVAVLPWRDDVGITDTVHLRASGQSFNGALLLPLRDGAIGGAMWVSTDAPELAPGRLTEITRPLVADVPRPADTDEPRPTATIAICTRNKPDDLRRCLQSFIDAGGVTCRLLVVDNAPSDDATKETVDGARAQLPTLDYVVEPKPGLSNARNRALDECTTDVLAFTDDDVEVLPGWIDRLLTTFAAFPAAAAVTGLAVCGSVDSMAELWRERRGGFDKHGFHRRHFSLSHPDELPPFWPYKVGVVGAGFNMAFRTPELRATGGFAPYLGAGTGTKGGEDLAIFFALLDAGAEIVYEPSAVLFHHHRADWDGLVQQMESWGRGYTAFLTHLVCQRPSRAFGMTGAALRAVKGNLFRRRGPGAPHHEGYPRELIRAEFVGAMKGPFAYAFARYRASRS